MAEKSHSAEAELSQANDAGPLEAPAKKDTTPVYELGFHVVPTVLDDGVAAVVEKLRGRLNDAEIISEQFPQKMTLAYTIERSVQGKREKYTESYFGSIKFAAEREGIPALQQALTAMPEVLRYLVVGAVREEAAPRRAIYTSSRLEGETIQKPQAAPEKPAEVSDEELNKSIEALVN